MGAGASLASLPEEIDKPTACALAGERFDDAAFQKLATNGKVTRAAFLAAAAAADADSPAQLLPTPPMVTRLPSHDKDMLKKAYGEQKVATKRKPKASAPWRSTAMFEMAADDDLDVQIC